MTLPEHVHDGRHAKRVGPSEQERPLRKVSSTLGELRPSLFSVEVVAIESDTRWQTLDDSTPEAASRRVSVTVPRRRWLLLCAAALLALETVLRWRRRRAAR